MTFKNSFSLTQSLKGLSSKQVCDAELNNVQKKTLGTSPGEIQSLTLTRATGTNLLGHLYPTAGTAACKNTAPQCLATDARVTWCHVKAAAPGQFGILLLAWHCARDDKLCALAGRIGLGTEPSQEH